MIKRLLKKLLMPLLKEHFSAPGQVALTFDDGPDPEVTPRILDALAQADAHATFFVIGNKAAQYPDILERMRQEGHEIGNHSWNHPELGDLSYRELKREFEQTDAVIGNGMRSVAVPSSSMLRPI